ncbi:hypothetical protein U1Q18_043355 [Sarracenia purpurea var. burkii]
MTGRHNEEDWAAKARAWAAATAASDNQHSQSQFTPVSKLEEQVLYHDQYHQTVDPHYPDVLQPSLPASGYQQSQQYPAPAAPPHRPPYVHPQESAAISFGQSSFVPDEHLTYGVRDGNLAGDSNAVFSQKESSPTSSSVHLQESDSLVDLSSNCQSASPSKLACNVSSVVRENSLSHNFQGPNHHEAGKEETVDRNQKFFKSYPLPIDSSQGLHHLHPPLPNSVSMEQPLYAVGNQAAESPTDLSDKPLDFTRRFNHDHDHDQIIQPNHTRTDSGGPIRGVDPVAAPLSNYTWASPAARAAVYPPIPPHDPSIAVPSPHPGSSAPLFGRMPGPSFQPTIPSVGASFGISTGSGLYPTMAFPGDIYGVSSISDRPKKASVPNWLREEIIKKKGVIASSAPGHQKEETEFIEDEATDKSIGKSDQADSKSIDSSRSAEEEDDDEDYVEATRTAAINQEIKLILTEVLMKVTDELFDEIATKVLSEGDLTVEVDQTTVDTNRKLSPSVPPVPSPKASAKVLIPAKTKGTDTEDDIRRSTSSSKSPGDVLGLGSYASDDDEDDDNTVFQQPSPRKLSEDKHTVENGSSLAETEGQIKDLPNEEGKTGKMVSNGASIHHGSVASELSVHRTSRGSSDDKVGPSYSSKTVSGLVGDEDNMDGEKMLESVDASMPNPSVKEKAIKTEPVDNINSKKSVKDDSRGREIRNKEDKSDRRETKRSSAGKDVKELDSRKDKIGERDDENHRRQDERRVKRERLDDRNGSEGMNKQAGKSDSRKSSVHPDVEEDRKEKERDIKPNAKEDRDRRKERTKDEKRERSRHKPASESSRHKRRRSSSVGSRGRSSKDNSVVGHAYDSSDESSDDSKRELRLHSKSRNLSPATNRSRRRQDSRSPHSKPSQRRHSPYSSLETTRGRRSRSRSPVRRQR